MDKVEKNNVQEFIQNPKKALFKLAIPIVTAMAVQTMYNIVDTAYVGRLGADSIAALTFSFPIFFGLIALNSIIDIGMQSRIARLMGAGRKGEAENTALHAIGLSVILAVFVFILGSLTLKPLFIIFGATEEVAVLAVKYTVIILSGTIFMFPAYIVNSIFISQGDTQTPMKVQIASLIVNAILEPLFIYTLDLGVPGSAIATVIAFLFSLGLAVSYLGEKSYLRIKLRLFTFSSRIVKEILRVGIPSSVMVIIISVYIIFINKFMAHFGTEYVATFGIASRLESLAMLPVLGFSTALLTLAAMFYGARRYDLLKGIIWYGLRIVIAFACLFSVLFFIAPSFFFRIFTPDTEIINLGKTYIKIDALTFPLMAVMMVVSRVLQGMGFGMPGMAINVIRIFLVAVPLAYLFVYVLDYSYLSVAWAMVIGGIASNIAAVFFLERRLKKINESH